MAHAKKKKKKENLRSISIEKISENHEIILKKN